MERNRGHELFSVTLSLGLLALSFFAFSPSVKEEIRKKYNYRCAETGEYNPHIQIHHKVPQCFNGSDRIENGVALSPRIHAYWDKHTQETGEVYPGIPLNQVPPTLFKNETVREGIIYKFEHNLPLVGRIVHCLKHKGKHKKYRGQGR